MKKAIVLGVLAFFAINITTVQNANAQDKKKVTTTSTTEVKAEKADKEAVKMEKPMAKPEIKSEKAAKEKEVKATEKKEVKATEKKEVKATEKKEVKATEKKVTTKDDPTAKKAKPNKTVPPAEKEKRTASGSTQIDR